MKIRIDWRAELDGINEVRLSSTTPLTLRIRCAQCRQEHERPVSVDLAEQVPVPNSRGTANFVMKCSMCKQHCSINNANPHPDDKPSTGSIVCNQEGSIDYQPLITLDIRGLEVEECLMVGECEAVTENGSIFPFEMEEELADYDEQAGCPVSVTELSSRVVKL